MVILPTDPRGVRRLQYMLVMRKQHGGKLSYDQIDEMKARAIKSADNMSDLLRFSDQERVKERRRLAAGGRAKLPPMTGGPIDRSAAFPKSGLYRTICMRGD